MVVALQKPRQRRLPLSSYMPSRFSAHDSELLLRWAMAQGFKYEELLFAVTSVREWAENRSKAPLRRCWVKAVEQAMRQGWALRGYREERARRSGPINPRTGLPILRPERVITEELIARHLAKLSQP